MHRLDWAGLALLTMLLLAGVSPLWLIGAGVVAAAIVSTLFAEGMGWTG
jgi:hypothetical protein